MAWCDLTRGGALRDSVFSPPNKTLEPASVAAALAAQGRGRWTGVIVEHEIIEQVEDEPRGRSIGWCAELAGQLGACDPLVTLREMCRAGHLQLVGTDGAVLQPWQAEQVWRVGDARRDIAVHATDLGSKFAHG